MKLLRNKFVAVVIALCLIAAAICFGTARSLQGLRDEALETLYTGSENTAQTQGDMLNIAENGATLASLAGSYIAAEDPQVAALSRSAEDLRYAYDSPKAGKLAEQVYIAAQALNNRLDDVSLSDDHKDRRAWLVENIDSSMAIVARGSGYNEAAHEFNRRLEQFPANLLSGVIGVEPLHTY